MIKVYFEMNNGKYAEQVAIFENEQLYNELVEELENIAHSWGFDKVTEVEE